MGIHQAFLGTNNAGPRDLADATVTGSNTQAVVVINTDGTVTPTQNWYLPTTTGIGSSYWAKITRLSGDAVHNDAPGPIGDYWPYYPSATPSWQQITSNITYGYHYTSGYDRTGVHRVEIASDSGGSNIVSSGDFTLTILPE